jgi:hypothetical protein
MGVSGVHREQSGAGFRFQSPVPRARSSIDYFSNALEIRGRYGTHLRYSTGALPT